MFLICFGSGCLLIAKAGSQAMQAPGLGKPRIDTYGI
jgi:hypothetical protein